MKSSVRADLGHFVKHLVLAFQPIAKAEDIDLSFTVPKKEIIAVFQAATLAADLSPVMSKLIEFTPEQEHIHVTLDAPNYQKCKIKIKNTGINLARNSEITSSCHLPVAVSSELASTLYEFEIDLFEEPPLAVDTTRINGPNYIPDYYAEIRKRLRSHFTKSDNLVAALSHNNPREAAFLTKVNSLIVSNMENSQFDANFLSEAMNMSRTQLFRRLKPIIRQSPGSYIRIIKLQKAKELFETTDMRISEVAYKTGFETASHFTKVFTKQYGVKPSLFCRRQSDATNG